MMLIALRLDPAADPWGTAMLACVVVCGFSVLWWIVAVAMRQSVRGTGRVMRWGLTGYLACAVGGTVLRVMNTPEPPKPKPPAAAPIVIQAQVPIDPDEDPKAAAIQAKAADAERAARRELAADTKATGSPDSKAEPTPDADAKVEVTPDAKAEPAPDASAPALPSATAEAVPEDSAEPGPDAVAPTARATTPPVEFGEPTLAGREALRFVDDVSHDAAKCADARQVADAARELRGALSEVTRGRVEKAAGRLETCRRKIVWRRASTIRRHRITDRQQLADALPGRLRAQGLSVQVSLRGQAHERIRIGGAKLDEARARALLDDGLRDELADAGFTDVTLADLKQSFSEQHTPPADAELAAAELASLGLERKIVLP